MARARAIERIRSSDDFLSLSQSAKRIRNILRKSAKPSDYEGGSSTRSALRKGRSAVFTRPTSGCENQAAQKRAEGDIYAALESVASLRSPVDLFFDKVSGDGRGSRGAQKSSAIAVPLDRLFTEDADLSLIEKPNVDAST